MDKKNISELLRYYYLVVPEIQREYVWGDRKNRAVLSQFLRDISDKALDGDVNIGFLYSYQSGNEHYLIDGQQRYTTLIVLLYYLSLSNDVHHKQFTELLKLDSVSPAFSYRVRSHTEAFLNNLFRSHAGTAKDIRNQKWYKSEYVTDTTIESIIGAIDIIDTLAPELSGLTFETVLNKIYFWYFDVAQTSQGEELYITMNSRGEKLTDSEQIKPRLLNRVDNIMEKEDYGKKWDDWEEFFFSKELRGTRPVGAIDEAMNNLIRVTLEMVSLSEHDQIKPVEDAERKDFDISVIESYMDAIKSIKAIGNGKYKEEIERLYGDSREDRNFYVLKALLTEARKGQHESIEYERVYQTIKNQVRRNKIESHIDYLHFLDDYGNDERCLYDFILNSGDEYAAKIFTGHELEKLSICRDLEDSEVEKAFWEVQSSPHWKGEFKSLLSWSKLNDKFSFKEFIRLRSIFDKLFDKKGEGWTTDKVRQALIASRISNYPNGDKFGYTDSEWKDIFSKNSIEFKTFLDSFDGVSDIDAHIKNIKDSYPETPDNPWAEFVHHDDLLNYCNTKHLYWLDRRGWMLVKNSWAKPFAVKDQLLYSYLLDRYTEESLRSWGFWRYDSWNSCVYFQNPEKVFFDIRVMRNSGDEYFYQIVLSKRGATDEAPLDTEETAKFIPKGIQMNWDGEKQRFVFETTELAAVDSFIDHCLSL